MYDEQATADISTDGAYRVTHKNEKFSVGRNVGVIKNSNSEAPNGISNEEKELAEALQKIREMEDQEQLKINKEEQILTYLK